MLEFVRPLLGVGGGRTVVYECRRCGQSLDADADRCPHCGPTDVVRFEVD